MAAAGLAGQAAWTIIQILRNPDYQRLVQEEVDTLLPPGREEHKQHRFSLIGFGGGKHKCMGMNFANNEMMIITALLFQQYELALLTPDPEIRRGVGANRPPETWLCYRARQRAAAHELETEPARV